MLNRSFPFLLLLAIVLFICLTRKGFYGAGDETQKDYRAPFDLSAEDEDKALDVNVTLVERIAAQNVLPTALSTEQSPPLVVKNRKTARKRSSRKRKRKKKFQPKVTVVEKQPARKVFSSISMPEGSPWCDGLPTYWLTGHQKFNETPWCKVEGGSWQMRGAAVLDVSDRMNTLDKSKTIDRHSCLQLDINLDGLPDIICLVGANKGKGSGYDEVYLTRSDGTLEKIEEGHGLQKYPSMRGRLIVSLKDATGTDLVFIATEAKKRKDKLPNQHRMFRNTFGRSQQKTNEKALKVVSQPSTGFAFFEEVPGPWINYFQADCVVPADVNGDGIDDLIVCNERNVARIFIQKLNGSWKRQRLSPPSSSVPSPKSNTKKWRNVRVADVDRDGKPDLLVVGSEEQSYIRIFRGIRKPPYFDFEKPYYEKHFPYATPDLEVLDVNNDRRPDIYVVQKDESQNDGYCASHGNGVNDFWGEWAQPSKNWKPPKDKAPDVLLIGRKKKGRKKKGREAFKAVQMKHAYPGCGGIAKKFGDDQTMLLAQGDSKHAGYHLLLEWR